MADSEKVVKALFGVDPQFVELCKTMFGPDIDAASVWEFLYGRDGISKMNPAPSDLATRGAKAAKGILKPLGIGVAGGVAANQFPQSQGGWRKRNVAKSTEVQWDVEFSKVDEDKRQVFGWASIVKMNGKPVVDRQGDLIDEEEIEKAAYAYVQKSRKGGNQHKRTDDDQPFHASDMIESIVFTDEKIAKMGLPDDFPRGWWTGFQVNDDATWADIKAGRKTGFSIHGRGRRQEVPV